MQDILNANLGAGGRLVHRIDASCAIVTHQQRVKTNRAPRHCDPRAQAVADGLRKCLPVDDPGGGGVGGGVRHGGAECGGGEILGRAQ